MFPVVNAAHLLGSAQTVNLIDIIVQGFGGQWNAVAFHALGLFLYVLAIFLATLLPKHTKLHCKLLALAVDAAACVVMWRFPIQKNLPLVIYLYPTFFALPFQWCAFKGAYGFTSSTIFSTNNLRQFVSALTEVWCNGDTSFTLKAQFFGATLLAFHLGVAASWLCWHFFGNAGFLFALAPICVTAIFTLRSQAISKSQTGED